MIRPNFDEIEKIAEAKKYKVVPVSCEILSDEFTPIEVIRILKNVSTHCYLLESAAEHNTWGRYTFLGYDPKLEITCIDGRLKVGSLEIETDDPSKYIRKILSDYTTPKYDYLPPFTGGLVGYFSYDYLKYSEPSVRIDVEDEEKFKDVDLMLFDKVIVFDNFAQKLILIANMKIEEGEAGYNKAVMELRNLISLLKKGEKHTEKPGRMIGEL